MPQEKHLLEGMGKVRHESIFRAALSYASRGCAILPMHTARTPTHSAGSAELVWCTCSAGVRCHWPAKHPRYPEALWEATTDERTIRRWLGRWPKSNIATRLGKDAGIFVLDIDYSRPAWAEVLDRLVGDFGMEKPAAMSRTGRGGLNLYYAYENPRPEWLEDLLEDAGESDLVYRTDDPSEVPTGSVGPSIDVTGDREPRKPTWATLPPSKSVQRYEWLDVGDFF